MKQITLFAVAVLLFCSSLTRAQNASDDMAMAVLSEKMDKLGAEMDDLERSWKPRVRIWKSTEKRWRKTTAARGSRKAK